jgi:nucleoside-diphosphate-sugar epimerase
LSKLAAEHITRINADRHGIGVITARIFNVVGPGQADSHVCGRLAAQLASLARAGPAVLEVGALDTTRDFVDVRDLATALLLVAHRGDHGSTYNVGSGRETPIRFILSELIRMAQIQGLVTTAHRKDQPAGVPRHCADISRLQRLGFVPTYSLAESLTDLLRYHQALQVDGAGSQSVIESPRSTA